jgi:transcriptional regulator with XRE-family HTH domain
MENIGNRKYIEIGKRIKEAREKEELTQAELASQLGYSSPTFISLIEDGKRKVRIDDLEKIGKILHRDVDFFIRGEVGQATSVQMALRADKHLDQNDIKTIESVIEALKRGKDNKNGRSRGNT